MIPVQLFPKNVIELSAEVKKLCDAFWEQKITQEELTDSLVKLNNFLTYFENKQIVNKTVSRKIGQRREKLVVAMLTA